MATGSTSRRTLGRWMARAGARTPRRGRRAGAGAAALAAAVGAAVQPVGGAGAARSRGKRRPGRGRWRSSACKATAQQVGLSRAERARNVQGAFRVPERQAPRWRAAGCVLVDDVLTSGATVDACARALLRAGAANVDVLVFARVVDARAPAHIEMRPVDCESDCECLRSKSIRRPCCGYCRAAKALLERKGVAFTRSTSAANRSARDEMIERANGRTTVPQIFIGATHVGGCDDSTRWTMPASSIRC